MALLRNPELIRNARMQLRTRKVLAVAAICAVLSFSVGYFFYSQSVVTRGSNGRWAMELLQIVIGAQALILAAGGSIACLSSIYKEKAQKSFDFQRVTRLTPLQLALGKLFGAPALMYFVCLCLMPLSIFVAILAKPRLLFFLAAYAALLVASITLHSIGLLMSVLSIRGSQTGAIILLLILLWVTAFPGNVTSFSLFRIGSLGPFFASGLVSETTWDPAQIEQKFSSNGEEYTLNRGMTDLFFGYHVHHAPVLLIVDSLLALWFLLAIARNIKRDPAEYELYSPAQSLGFALSLNVLFLAFFNWHFAKGVDGCGFLLSLNIAVFALLGLAILRNRERMRRILRARPQSLPWLQITWPAPLLLVGTLGAGALIAAGATYSGIWSNRADLPFSLFLCLFFGLWLIRDLQFLQWISLCKGRNPLAMGVLYLIIFYVVAGTLLSALTHTDQAWDIYSAFPFPTAAYNLNAASWALHSGVWVAAIVTQFVVIAFFFYLQSKKIAELSESSSLPAPAVAQVAV
jgi:hypothetical protein